MGVYSSTFENVSSHNDALSIQRSIFLEEIEEPAKCFLDSQPCFTRLAPSCTRAAGVLIVLRRSKTQSHTRNEAN